VSLAGEANGKRMKWMGGKIPLEDFLRRSEGRFEGIVTRNE
jgi:hypothetical protein